MAALWGFAFGKFYQVTFLEIYFSDGNALVKLAIKLCHSVFPQFDLNVMLSDQQH